MKGDKNMNEQILKQEVFFGGRPRTVKSLLDEITYHRRKVFQRMVFSCDTGSSINFLNFDSVGFVAAIKNIEEYFNINDVEYEGSIEYEVTAGGSCVWHCTTTITWVNCHPVAYGMLKYSTEVTAGDEVDMTHIDALTGTNMTIKVIKNDLKVLTKEDALERSKPI